MATPPNFFAGQDGMAFLFYVIFTMNPHTGGYFVAQGGIGVC
jgi:hypothetical protein